MAPGHEGPIVMTNFIYSNQNDQRWPKFCDATEDQGKWPLDKRGAIGMAVDGRGANRRQAWSNVIHRHQRQRRYMDTDDWNTRCVRYQHRSHPNRLTNGIKSKLGGAFWNWPRRMDHQQIIIDQISCQRLECPLCSCQRFETFNWSKGNRHQQILITMVGDQDTHTWFSIFSVFFCNMFDTFLVIFQEKSKLRKSVWVVGQCVTKPKIWTKPNSEFATFSGTNFFRYRIRYFFRYQIFSNTDTFLILKF